MKEKKRRFHMIGIYLITNKINQQKYVGQSIDIQTRFKQHFNRSLNKNSVEYNKVLYQAFREFGIDNFLFEILEECKIEDLDAREIYYISFYDCIYPKGYNRTIGGSGGPSGVKFTKETIQPLIQDLQLNLELSIKDLEEKYQISHQMIYDINNGKHWIQEDLIYPLRKLNHEPKRYFCIDCGKEIYKGSTRCVECHSKSQQTVARPEPFDLLEQIALNGFVKTGQKYGVSDKSVAKWCVAYNLPSKKQEIIDYYNQIMEIFPTERRKVTITKATNKQGKILLQIDKESGEILQKFDSCVAAAIALGNREYNKHISSAAAGSRASAYGYKWRYE
jgi:hypothetical protein